MSSSSVAACRRCLTRSKVWLKSELRRPSPGNPPVLHFEGDSDAHIVRGLIAILFSMYQDRTSEEILATDAVGAFESLGLKEHLTPQRSNGFASMVERMRSDAREAASRETSAN
jgi:cysteine desulfuration protein SufE